MAADVERSFAVLAPFGGHQTRYFRFPGGATTPPRCGPLRPRTRPSCSTTTWAPTRSRATPRASPPACCGRPTTARSSSCTSRRPTRRRRPTRCRGDRRPAGPRVPAGHAVGPARSPGPLILRDGYSPDRYRHTVPSRQDSSWVGSMPEVYDRCLGPAFFQPFAVEVAHRAARLASRAVLELAAGTGVGTRELVALPGAWSPRPTSTRPTPRGAPVRSRRRGGRWPTPSGPRSATPASIWSPASSA